MTGAPQHEISDIEVGPGEVSFVARIDGNEQRIWFRTEAEVDPHPDLVLAAALMPAMRSGGRLTTSAPISPRLLRNQDDFQAIQQAWSLEWTFGDSPLREVEVVAPTRDPEQRSPTGRVAAFFSGGVDSWSTVLGEPDLTDLIFIRGTDILAGLSHQKGLADRVEERLRAAATEVGLPLHVVETNVRELSEPRLPTEPLVRWSTYYNSVLASVAHLFGVFDRVLITGEFDYEVQPKMGSSWLVDRLWSNENLEIVGVGGRFNRVQRTEQIADHPAVRKSLRVCWENPDGAYNCGRCSKCLRTMVTLEALGALEQTETFPAEIDLELLADQEVPLQPQLIFWEEVLDLARRTGRADLERPVTLVVANGRRKLGLPAHYRSRRLPEPPPPDGGLEVPAPRLLATPETAQALAEAEAVAFLTGSYDGSGNYGDIAQLDGALRMLGKLDGDLLVLPVLERQFAATHRTLANDLLHEPQHVLYFDDGNGEFDDDLIPLVSAPPHLALSYLYGGGFLNPSWGERKLAMLRAVEETMKGAGAVTRIASGQQVDAGWIAELESADRNMLASFELLGARDDASAEALAQLVGADSAPNSGDDAVGILQAIGEGARETDLVVNVHIAEHPWVTDRPDEVRAFDVGLLAELSQLIGQPLRVRPLLAYLDPRVDERPGLERFAAACEERGIEVGEARVLRPASIAELAPELGGALLTVSCSYHVALTSLLLAVPTVILRDNPYYDQKARGLLADFALPDFFSPSSDDDPERCAAEIAAILLNEEGEETRRRLEKAAERVRRRRFEAEADLLARVARGALLATAPPPSSVAEAGQRSAEEKLADAVRRATDAERREAEAQATLADALGSSSWKLTAPLRRLAAFRRKR